VIVILFTVIYIKVINWLSMNTIPVIPRPPMVRQTCNQQATNSDVPGIIQPLLWAIEPIIENPIKILLVPEELRSKCITAHGHFNEANLALCLERAFIDLGYKYTREGNVYRWDVRITNTNSRLDTILEVRIFCNVSGSLLVYFNKHYGYDSMIAYDMIDQIARNAYLDIQGSFNPLTKVYDDW
jgi:hypothetical protein